MMRKSSIRYYLLGLVFISISSITIQFFYNFVMNGEEEAIVSNFRTIFSDHKSFVNPYHLAQSVNSMESFSSIRCSKIFAEREGDKDFVFLDLSYKSICKESGLFLSGKTFSTGYTAIDGKHWKVTGFIESSPFMKTVFWSFRIISTLIIALCLWGFRVYSNQKEISHKKEIEIQGLKHQKYKDVVNATQNISHDLKGPIGVIAKAFDATCWNEYVSNLASYKSALFRLQTMVSSLKEADIDSIVRDNWTTSFTLTRVVSELQISYANINISLEEMAVPDRIKIDTDKLDRSVSNLIINAIEAGAKNIECSTTIAGDSLVISVSDDGPGVPDHIKPKMFERGFTFGKASGSGLGLSFALTTARGHGGDISYTRDNGRSFFTMTLPNVVSQQDAAATEIDGSQPAVPQNWEHRPKAKKLVLVCLNDPARQQAITEGLHQDQITNDIGVMDSCLFVFTDDLTLVEQCLQIKKPIFFDSSSSVEAAVHKIQNELQKA